ncbi:MAG: hypothetical protein ACR2G7_10545 [Acidimicrobiales bacterium]
MLTPEQLPPLALGEVNEPAKEWSRLHAESVAADRRLFDLEEARQAAVEQDQGAYAKALRTGRGDPGAKLTAKIDAELGDARRRADALQLAVADAYADLQEAIRKHSAAWRDILDRQREEAVEAFNAALASLQAADRQLGLVKGTIAWLDRGVDRPFNPARHVLVDLVGRNGEPAPMDSVLAALTAIGQVPALTASGIR